ncbi:quinone oxidoreductase [Ectopseudomonas oleovorans]|nr:quinone oxidoreductase [Pseudomonas oleovorans]
MKAVRFHQTGGPEQLIYEDVPTPQPSAGEVLLRVKAAGVNFADVMRRRGENYPEPTPLPFILGYEMTGVIEAHGEGVTAPPVGTMVFVASANGAYAEYAVASADQLIPVPAGISPEQMTALFVQGVTAYRSLVDAVRLQKGETILVEAAAGGVGSLIVQLAKSMGAGKVIAAASSPAKRELALRLGADHAVDYTLPGWDEQVRELTDGRGVDVVMEMVSGQVLPAALRSLAPFGRMVVFGGAESALSTIDTGDLVFSNRSIQGFSIAQYFERPDILGETLGELIKLVLGGKLQIQVGEVLPLSDAAEAHRLIEARKTTGKVVLKP